MCVSLEDPPPLPASKPHTAREQGRHNFYLLWALTKHSLIDRQTETLDFGAVMIRIPNNAHI